MERRGQGVCGSLPGRYKLFSAPLPPLSSSASLLACGTCQASGRISVISSPWLEGFDARLELQNVPEGVQEYSWHRGANDSADSMIVSYRPLSRAWQPGPRYSGRENVTEIGHLVIKDSRVNDTGSYTVQVDLGNEIRRATGWLEVQGELTGGSAPGT